MSQPLPDAAAARFKEEKKKEKVVLLCSLVCALLIFFVGAENLFWRSACYYPAAFARVRYVSNVSMLTPAAVSEICNTLLTQPELRIKSGKLYLRCGTPGVEGVWRIETYD